MKKLTILFLALATFSCSNRPDKDTTDNSIEATSQEEGKELIKCEFILKINRQIKTDGIRCTYPVWSNDGSTIICDHVAINIETEERKPHNNEMVAKIDSTPRSELFVYIDQKTLKIMAKSPDSVWAVTKDQGQYYSPLLSRDKRKVLVHRGAEMLIYATDGSGLMTPLGRGIGSSWSIDDKQILFIRVKSPDGHQITGSELYIANIDGSGICQLTNSPESFEMWADWSPNGKSLIYIDDKTREIYVCEVVRQ